MVTTHGTTVNSERSRPQWLWGYDASWQSQMNSAKKHRMRARVSDCSWILASSIWLWVIALHPRSCLSGAQSHKPQINTHHANLSNSLKKSWECDHEVERTNAAGQSERSTLSAFLDDLSQVAPFSAPAAALPLPFALSFTSWEPRFANLDEL